MKPLTNEQLEELSAYRSRLSSKVNEYWFSGTRWLQPIDEYAPNYVHTYANVEATKPLRVAEVTKSMQAFAEAIEHANQKMVAAIADMSIRLSFEKPPKPEPLVCTDCHATLREDQVSVVGGLPYCRYCDHRAALNVSCRENDDHGFDRLAETPQRGAQVKADNSFWDE